jgi:CxxC-x17-CxxC domain-containing protein
MSYNRDDNRRSNNFGGNFQRQMYDATCSACGKKTQVPFKPREGSDVFCKECYFKNKNGGKTYNKRDSNEEEEY